MIIASLQNKSAGLQFLEILYCIKTFAAYVGDGKRFNNGNEAANYVGPVPRRCAVYSPTVSLLKRDDADARSVQKTPAGVLDVRRGLFFVKRQRRCVVYFKRSIDLDILQ